MSHTQKYLYRVKIHTRLVYRILHRDTCVYDVYVVQLCTCQHHVVFPYSYRPSSPQPSATSVCHPLPLTRVLTSSDIAVLRWGIERLFIFSYFGYNLCAKNKYLMTSHLWKIENLYFELYWFEDEDVVLSLMVFN